MSELPAKTRQKKAQPSAITTGEELISNCRHDKIDVWIPFHVEKVTIAVRDVFDKKEKKVIQKATMSVAGWTPCGQHARSSTWDQEKHIGAVEEPTETGEKEDTRNIMGVEKDVVYLQRINKNTTLFPIEAGPNGKSYQYGFDVDIRLKYGAKNVFKRASQEQLAVCIDRYGPVEDWSKRDDAPLQEGSESEEDEEDDDGVMQFAI